MPSAAGSIPPLAPSRPPPAVVLRSDRFGAYAHGTRAVARERSAARRSAAPRLSLVPPPPSAAIEPVRPLAAGLATVAPAAPLTAIAFRPDGRPALTLRLGALHGLAAVVLASGMVGAALALGWLLGEWTARL
jgi:hypothetical protein